MEDTFERNSEYHKGDRVELAPWLDLRAYGVHYATVRRDRGGPYVDLDLGDGDGSQRSLPRTSIRRVDTN